MNILICLKDRTRSNYIWIALTLTFEHDRTNHFYIIKKVRYVKYRTNLQIMEQATGIEPA